MFSSFFEASFVTLLSVLVNLNTLDFEPTGKPVFLQINYVIDAAISYWASSSSQHILYSQTVTEEENAGALV